MRRGAQISMACLILVVCSVAGCLTWRPRACSRVDFSVPSSVRWIAEGGTWKIENGVLRQSDTDPVTVYATLMKTVQGDAAISVRVRRSGGAAYLGIRSIPSGTRVLFGITENSAIARFSAGDGPEWINEDIPLGAPADGWCAVRMEIKGRKVRCFINESFVHEAPLPEGPFQVLFATYHGAAEFDDLDLGPAPRAWKPVTAPKPKPANATVASACPPVPRSRFLQYQWGLSIPGYCQSELCVDLDNNGERVIVLGVRADKSLKFLRGSDGTVLRSVSLDAEVENACAYDVNDDGYLEILCTTQSPATLQVVSHDGTVVAIYRDPDSSLCNQPVVIDADFDGRPEAYFGTRNRSLIALDLATMTPKAVRDGWVQCGCQTAALDLDRSGSWSLFAGSGDDVAGRDGTLHRLDPTTLQSIWSYRTGWNAASGSVTLADINADGKCEILKATDDYGHTDRNGAIWAFRADDGTLLWKVEGAGNGHEPLACEDSPSAADLEHDGRISIVGMTFGSEVFCLDADGSIRWRTDLNPAYDNGAHSNMSPILCDVNGDDRLEILAMSDGGWYKDEPATIYVLDSNGRVLDRLTVGAVTCGGGAPFYCDVDGDGYMELVLAGKGGIDVVKTLGRGPNSEHFTSRRSYRRNNVVTWAYEEDYFIFRGIKDGVTNLADNLVLAKNRDGLYRPSGRYVTELLTLPNSESRFDRLTYEAVQPEQTRITVNILDAHGRIILENVKDGQQLRVQEPVRIEFCLETHEPSRTPRLDAFRLTFVRASGKD